jgi:hypothetical protein
MRQLYHWQSSGDSHAPDRLCGRGRMPRRVCTAPFPCAPPRSHFATFEIGTDSWPAAVPPRRGAPRARSRSLRTLRPLPCHLGTELRELLLEVQDLPVLLLDRRDRHTGVAVQVHLVAR